MVRIFGNLFATISDTVSCRGLNQKKFISEICFQKMFVLRKTYALSLKKAFCRFINGKIPDTSSGIQIIKCTIFDVYTEENDDFLLEVTKSEFPFRLMHNLSSCTYLRMLRTTVFG